jgi:hypothetical protein
VTAPLGVYLGLLTGAAWLSVARGRHRTTVRAEPKTRFAVLVPAHDEERLIGRTVDSLRSLDYPRERFDVHVVADNCTDRTVAIVREHGAEAHDRVAPDAPGKGPALGWLLDRLRDAGRDYDAYVIVDADTTVSPTFLRVMDAALAGGATVVQAHYAVADPSTSPTTAFRAAALALRHYLRPLGRTAIGGSTGLYGNGMVFTADVLGRRSFSNHLTEDIELQLELLADGTKVAFAPDALVEAEMPDTLEASRTQHERWERGRIELARRFLPGLVRRTVTGGPAGRVAYADAALDQLSPPFSLLALGSAAAAALAVGEAALVGTPAARRRACVAVAALATQTIAVVSALRLVRAPWAVYRALAGAPRLVVWKLRLWLRMLARPGREGWVRTARNQGTGAA